MKHIWTALSAMLVGLPAYAQEVDSGYNDIVASGIRMTLGLLAVLAILGVAAWLLRRYRGHVGGSGGSIEVIGGLALGTKDRVVLLKVMGERVLVGIGPAGMTRLHVLRADSQGVFELPEDIG